MENWNNINKMLAPGLGFYKNDTQIVPEVHWNEPGYDEMIVNDHGMLPVTCSKCGKKIPAAIQLQHESVCQEKMSEIEDYAFDPELGVQKKSDQSIE